MASEPRVREEADGVRVVSRGRWSAGGRVLGVAMACALGLAVGLGWITMRDLLAPAATPPEPARTDVARADADSTPRPRTTRVAAPPAPSPPAAAAPASGEPRPTPRRVRRAEAPAAAEQDRPEIGLADVRPFLQGTEGIGVFPLPGTDPPKPGLVVPDDFELPEGYVRHNQVTDDGQILPPILMFHPDYEWVDAEGRAVTIPADRVVPPELAPPGLPLRMLEIPAPVAHRNPLR